MKKISKEQLKFLRGTFDENSVEPYLQAAAQRINGLSGSHLERTSPGFLDAWHWEFIDGPVVPVSLSPDAVIKAYLRKRRKILSDDEHFLWSGGSFLLSHYRFRRPDESARGKYCCHKEYFLPTLLWLAAYALKIPQGSDHEEVYKIRERPEVKYAVSPAGSFGELNAWDFTLKEGLRIKKFRNGRVDVSGDKHEDFHAAYDNLVEISSRVENARKASKSFIRDQVQKAKAAEQERLRVLREKHGV